MAFEFLRDALGLAGAAASVGSMFGLGGGGESKAIRQAAQRQAAIAEALANPQSPMFQQARQQAMEQSRQAMRDYLDQQAQQARRFQVGGGTSFYARNPRRDEAAARMITEMGQNEQAKADAAARAQLSGAAGAYGTAMQGYDVANRARQQQRAAQLSGLAGGLYGAGEILGRLPLMGQATQGPVQGSVNEPRPQDLFGDIFQRNRFERFGG